MRSATLLILVSASFVLLTMYGGKRSPSWWPGNHDGAAPAPAGRATAPSFSWPSLAKPISTQPGPARPVLVKAVAATPPVGAPSNRSPSAFLSSALSLLKNSPSGPGTSQKSAYRRDLRIARGLVKEELPNGLVLDCGGWVVKSATNPGVYAGDGRGMNAIYANLVVTHERLQFGRLMAVDHGALRESVYPPEMWIPETYVYGIAFLEGYPVASPGRGKGLKVVAAPSGSIEWQGNSIPSYTATFALED